MSADCSAVGVIPTALCPPGIVLMRVGGHWPSNVPEVGFPWPAAASFEPVTHSVFTAGLSLVSGGANRIQLAALPAVPDAFPV